MPIEAVGTDTGKMRPSDRGLTHVRWVGGATGAGKSTLAAAVSRTRQLPVYSTDAAIPAHSADPGPDAPLLRAFLQMNMDERWLRRDASTMLASFPWFAGERFERVVDDLQEAQPAGPVLAEGFRLLPRLVRPLLTDRRHGLWLTATTGFRRQAFAQRKPEQQFWRQTSDPANALERLLERDALFAERTTAEAAVLGLKVVLVDGSRSEADLLAEAEEWLGL